MPQVVAGHVLSSSPSLAGPLAIFYGLGAPSASTDSNVINCAVGSLYLRTDGGSGSTLYVRESSGAWAAK